MKVIRKGEGNHFDPANHWGCWPMRQHGEEESGATKIWVAVSHFLPDGGGKDEGLPAERIYYVLSGTMKVKSGGKEVTLNEGDSVFRPAHEGGEYWNPGTEPCTNLVIVVPV